MLLVTQVVGRLGIRRPLCRTKPSNIYLDDVFQSILGSGLA